MDKVIEKVHKEQEVMDEKHDDELDEYAYSKEELDRIIEEDDQGGIICDEKFMRYMRWVIDNMEEGIPFNPPIEKVPEEFRCYIQ